MSDWLEKAELQSGGWGLEGAVRMNAGFRMIWCDVASLSFGLITWTNVNPPEMPEPTISASSSTLTPSHIPKQSRVGGNLDAQIVPGVYSSASEAAHYDVSSY